MTLVLTKSPDVPFVPEIGPPITNETKRAQRDKENAANFEASLILEHFKANS